jgi:glycosyltransferase involved in cell wall biosynthesis
MRTLVIAGDWPWPGDTGSRLRLAMVLRGLLRCGPTELVSVVSKFRSDFAPADEAFGLAKAERVGYDNRSPTGTKLASSALMPSMPIGLPWHDRRSVRSDLLRLESGRFDLLWYFGARTYVLAGERTAPAAVVDLDDLEDQKIAARLEVPRTAPVGTEDRVRRVGSRAVAEEEIRRWRRLHRRIGRHCTVVVVCSELDAGRARAYGLVNTAVIPNGYPVIEHPVGRSTVGSPPTVLFQGLLTYPANVEAARWLTGEVGPSLRSLVPDARIRLVGKHHPDLLDLDDPPRVSVVGRVPDMADELRKADLVVVPVRYGSGTRLKILEAFAQRVPVVSTTLGAEGLGVQDGVHLLLGDTAPALAGACARLLGDRALRDELTGRAHAFFLERFGSEVVEEQVARLARRVAGA